LSLGQIHSALAYYWDHKDEIDADVQRRLEEAETLRRDAGPSPVARKLRGHGWTASTWPPTVAGLAGTWADEPKVEIAREGAAADLPREPL
jgi:alkylation response protein AidB-like acyl-CoA dehydrogenase